MTLPMTADINSLLPKSYESRTLAFRKNIDSNNDFSVCNSLAYGVANKCYRQTISEK